MGHRFGGLIHGGAYFRNFMVYLGIETVFCRLLQGMARMDMDLNLEKLAQLFHVSMLCLQKIS